MLDIQNLIEDCIAAHRSLVNSGTEHAFVSFQFPVELDAPLLPPGQHEHVYWARPGENYHAIGLGRIFYRTANGAQRFKLLQTAFQEQCTLWEQPPIAFMAFAFDAEATCFIACTIAVSDCWLSTLEGRCRVNRANRSSG